ncbi:hypothetical protein ACW4TU_18645 [Streptomyces sp. QTS52]
MSNTARPRCFSPADMARAPRTPLAARPAGSARPPTAEPQSPQPAPQPAAQEPRTPAVGDSIEPGRLRRDEHLRTLYSQAIRISRLLPNTRLVALTLLSYAHFNTGLIGARYQPTDDELAEATGLHADQVRGQVEILRQRGWCRARTITDGPRAGETALKLTVPALVLEQLRAPKSEPLPAG